MAALKASTRLDCWCSSVNEVGVPVGGMDLCTTRLTSQASEVGQLIGAEYGLGLLVFACLGRPSGSIEGVEAAGGDIAQLTAKVIASTSLGSDRIENSSNGGIPI